jgi:UDP-N-acetylglucosamine--N-acetylmuramyl-(pentapeptide) pyrophosphoryl-undecaprenol N-acetylglucosamine transferase
MLYVPDIEPGMALKLLANFADRIAVSADESQRYFRNKVIVTGYPSRKELLQWTRESGRSALKLANDLPMVLVMGGSKGARSINQAVVANLPALLEKAQIIHITGQLDWATVQRAAAILTPEQSRCYRAFPYLHEEIGAALASADLVVTRAGASTLGELPMNGLPAVLIPYPHAWRYQKVNADHLAEHGAAIILADEMLQEELLPAVTDLLENPSKRRAMHTAMNSLRQPEAANTIADLLLELGGKRP